MQSKQSGIINTVFDGEICLVDDDGNEDFQGVMKEIRRKDHQIDQPVFMMFDMITKSDFDNNTSTEILSTRLFLTGRSINSDILRYTEQVQITDDNHFDYWNELSSKEGWEGVMLRKDVSYEGKRTKNLVKVKKSFSMPSIR